MSKGLQRILLVAGVIALIALLIEIGMAIGATVHGNTPVRVEHVQAGPYPLTVSFYKDHADAGFALPFAISSSYTGALTYDVTSVPPRHISATPVRATISPDSTVHNGVQGDAEIPVAGQWTLFIQVNGPAGQAEADVPITATAPPAIPSYLGWLIGIIPLAGLLIFVLLVGKNRTREEQRSLAA